MWLSPPLSLSLFKKRFYLFLEIREGRRKERERNINVWKIRWSVAFCTSPAGDLTHNPGMCPDWEWNSDIWVPRLALSPLSPTSQGPSLLTLSLLLFFTHSAPALLAVLQLASSLPPETLCLVVPSTGTLFLQISTPSGLCTNATFSVSPSLTIPI